MKQNNNLYKFKTKDKPDDISDAVWEVLKTGTLYRSNPQDNLPGILYIC